jgi:Na+/glutamate symporter
MYLKVLGLALFTIFVIVLVAVIGCAFWVMFRSLCEMWGDDNAD